MTPLLTRLEAASAVDEHVVIALVLKHAKDQEWLTTHAYTLAMRRHSCGAYLDAVLPLVPEGAVWAISCSDSHEGFRATVMPKAASHDRTVQAATPALALCSAALRARG